MDHLTWSRALQIGSLPRAGLAYPVTHRPTQADDGERDAAGALAKSGWHVVAQRALQLAAKAHRIDQSDWSAREMGSWA